MHEKIRFVLRRMPMQEKSKTQRHLSPAHDSLAVQKIDDAGLKRGWTRVLDNGCCDNGVATIIECNRKR